MRIAITHHNADLDALASLVAATRVFPDTIAVLGSMVSPPVKRYLALHKDHYSIRTRSELDLSEVEKVIVVDVRDARRLREFKEVFENDPVVTVYDHHPPGEHDIEADVAVVEPVGACASLLVEKLLETNTPLSATEATLYLLGIYSDTGRLSYSTTRPIDIRVSAELVDRGASLQVVNRYLRREYSNDQSRLLVELMANTTEEGFDHVEIAFAVATTPHFVHGASSVVEQILELGGHDAIFGIVHFDKNDRTQIIGRSRVSYVDVGRLLSELGGGGHRGAGAATLKGTPIEDARQSLVDLLAASPLEPARVENIMSRPVHTLDHSITIRDAKEKLASWSVTGAPVMRDGKIAGIFSTRDAPARDENERLDLPVSSHMTHEVQSIGPREPIEDTLERMTAEDIGRLPVIDDGELVGIVTRTDLIRELYMKVRDDTDLQPG